MRVAGDGLGNRSPTEARGDGSRGHSETAGMCKGERALLSATLCCWRYSYSFSHFVLGRQITAAQKPNQLLADSYVNGEQQQLDLWLMGWGQWEGPMGAQLVELCKVVVLRLCPLKSRAAHHVNA